MARHDPQRDECGLLSMYVAIGDYMNTSSSDVTVGNVRSRLSVYLFINSHMAVLLYTICIRAEQPVTHPLWESWRKIWRGGGPRQADGLDRLALAKVTGTDLALSQSERRDHEASRVS